MFFFFCVRCDDRAKSSGRWLLGSPPSAVVQQLAPRAWCPLQACDSQGQHHFTGKVKLKFHHLSDITLKYSPTTLEILHCSASVQPSSLHPSPPSPIPQHQLIIAQGTIATTKGLGRHNTFDFTIHPLCCELTEKPTHMGLRHQHTHGTAWEMCVTQHKHWHSTGARCDRQLSYVTFLHVFFEKRREIERDWKRERDWQRWEQECVRERGRRRRGQERERKPHMKNREGMWVRETMRERERGGRGREWADRSKWKRSNFYKVGTAFIISLYAIWTIRQSKRAENQSIWKKPLTTSSW